MRHPALHPALLIAAFGALAGCGDWPDLDAQVGTAAIEAPDPELIALDPALAAAPRPGEIDTAAAALDARAEGVRARSERLAAPGLTADDLARIEDRRARLIAERDAVRAEQ